MSEDSRKPRRRAPAPDAAAAPTPPDATPALQGRFDLLAELGSGSSGTVYRARTRQPVADLPAGTEVAVKFLRQDRLDDERARERMLAEGRLGRRVRHPNVAAIHGAETIDLLGLQSTYLVMELVQGTTLRAFLQQQGPPVEDLTRRIGGDAAAGLHALHRRGIVHRDVKPENLVLTPDGRVKVVDLGLARPFGAVGGGSSPSGGIAGSLSYAAPEVLLGRPAQPRSDLYSLGVVLYEVATGRHPFAQHGTADAMLHAILHEAPVPPSQLRPRMTPLLEQLLLELLHKEPDERPRDADQVARILQQGEASDWWRAHVARAPVLASERRLRRMRRVADTPFFDRAAEQTVLDAALARARAGAGGGVCVQGPDGSGRRRLLDECMARWLQDAGDLLYLGGEADPGLGHGEPFAGSVRDHLLRGDGPNSPNAEQRLQHRAREELGLGEPDAVALARTALGTSTEPPEVRADALCKAIVALARPGRTVVVRVDRADRLDTSGRLALQRLLADAGRHHLLVLLAAGPDFAPAPPVERIELGGLDEDAFLAFGRALFGDAGGGEADALLHSAHVALSGSPGNLLEALEHLVQNGELQGRPGDYHALAPDAVLRPAPGHVQRFQRRVAALTPDQRRVLEAAAVLGDRSALDDLATLVQTPELQVLETLSLFRGRILRAQGGEVAFRHRDFRVALLQQIDEAARQELHRRAADLLAARGASPLEVGMHRSRALQHRECAEPLLRALDDLVAAGSRRTSLRVAARLRLHFQHLPQDPAHDALRLRWLLLHARARRDAQQPEVAEELFRAANELARRLGDEAGIGAALTGMAQTAMDRGRMLGALQLLETAHGHLARVAARDDAGAALAARAHGLHARILFYLGQSAGGLEHAQAGLRLLPPDQPELRCTLRIDVARLESLRHHFGAALATLRTVEEELRAVHLPLQRMRLFLYRGQLRTVLGDDAGVADLRLAVDAARRLSEPGFAGRAHLYLGEHWLRMQKDAAARADLHEAVDLALVSGDRLGETLARIHLFRLGADPVDIPDLVLELGLPSLRAAWFCAAGARARQDGDAAAAADWTARALEAMQSADLALPLQVRILHLAERAVTARGLVRAAAERLPDRASRRRFLSLWERRVRV